MIYTVGHSTYRDVKRFVEVLQPKTLPVKTVLDARSHPRAMFGHFYGKRMAQWLPEHGVEYVYAPKLGGWSAEHLPFAEKYAGKVDVAKYAGKSFPKDHVFQRIERPEYRHYWEIQGLWDVQWFMTLPSFFDGIEDVLRRHHAGGRLALMCAEVDWFHCHRAMISDFLLFLGYDTTHLHWNEKKIVAHSKAVNPENNEKAASRLEKYHPEVIALWNEIKPRFAHFKAEV